MVRPFLGAWGVDLRSDERESVCVGRPGRRLRMSLKLLPVLAAILAFSASLWAQEKDPFLGIWELNHGKSLYSPRRAQKPNVRHGARSRWIQKHACHAQRRQHYECRNPPLQLRWKLPSDRGWRPTRAFL